MSSKSIKTYVVGGPTASGKSSHALVLADRYDGVIINADSMQIYDALPILTAQPSEADKVEYPHRLYGILDPAEICSAQRWRDLALSEIESAVTEGKTPIIVGGTGFYMKALIEGLSPIPDISDNVQKATRQKHAEMGNPAFHAELAKYDPEMAERLHPNDSQRLMRAWEVLEETGKSLAQWQAESLIAPPQYLDFDVTVILPPRDKLYERCNKRFDMMLDTGALEEVKALYRKISGGVYAENVSVANALGFWPMVSYLNGVLSKEEAIEKSCQDTRNYAKRQITWFKNQMDADRIIEVPESR